MSGPKLLAAALVVVGIVGAGIILVRATMWAPDSDSLSGPQVASTSVAHAVATSSYPLRVRIPSLSIDAHVKYVGVNQNGNMATPGNFTDVAWYKYGTVPGEVGSAVMDGHVDNGLGLPGVFKHLADIRVGADVYVDTAGGKTLHFTVTDTESYPYQSTPGERIFNAHDARRLNLITCDGVWVAGKKTYDHRLVVYATMIS